MLQRHVVTFGALAGLCALGVAGCGSRAATGGTSGASGSGNTVIQIGVDAPLTGSLQQPGQGLKYAAQLAVNIANKQNEVPGVTFQLVAKDDEATASIGEQNATAFVADAGVVGVVGPMNSSVAQSEQSVYNAANLVEVSPATTNPSLSQGPNWKTAPSRPYKSFFRDITTDAIQGPFAADYVYKTLGLHTVATVDDGQTYGVGLMKTFTEEFTKLGGKVAVAQTATPTTTDYASVVSAIRSSGAQLVYYGGSYPAGAPLTKQLKAGGLNIPEMGGDGNDDPTYISTAGSAANGDYATLPGAALTSLATAKTFISEYQAANFPVAYGIYGGTSYDATWSIILAVKAALSADGGKVPSSTTLRSQVEAAEQNVSFNGVTGAVSFDKYGDTGDKVITMYKIAGGSWGNGVYTGAFTG